MDGGQGRAQLVAHDRHELALARLDCGSFGPFTERFNRADGDALGEEWRQDDLDGERRTIPAHVHVTRQKSVTAGYHEFPDGALLPGEGTAVRVLVVNDVMELPADQVFLPAAKHATGRQIREENQSVAIKADGGRHRPSRARAR